MSQSAGGRSPVAVSFAESLSKILRLEVSGLGLRD